MSSPHLSRLLQKYAEEPIGQPTVLVEESPGRFQHQRQLLIDFAHNLQTRFKVLLSEMEHDLGMLKRRQFDPDLWQALLGIWRHLGDIYRAFNQDKPYETASKLVQYVRSRHTRSILDNLDFLAKHHLKETNVSKLPAIPIMKHPEIKSLQLLLNWVDHLENYMKQNPLFEKEVAITPAMDTPTWKPPKPTGPLPEIIMPPSPAVPQL